MDKNNLPKDQSSFDNPLIDKKYENKVLEKIAKELSKNNSTCCSNCPENAPGVNSEPNDLKNIIIANCEGLLGIHFCENANNLELNLNDPIIINVNNNFEYATVLELGKLVAFRRDKTNDLSEALPLIDRLANSDDIEKHESNRIDANRAKTVFIQLVNELKLEMKLVDVHYQFDKKKMFFFYTADGRVDFRELAKRLASKYKTRIELRQIGVRDEAKRMGGLATCGREFCCSSFLNNFKRITTDIADENNISSNISKYTGPCGKLKCCLSYELN